MVSVSLSGSFCLCEHAGVPIHIVSLGGWKRAHTHTKKKVLGRRLSQRAHDAHGNVSPHQCGFELTSPSLDSGGDATMKANEAGSSGAAACPASAGNSRERERRKGK